MLVFSCSLDIRTLKNQQKGFNLVRIMAEVDELFTLELKYSIPIVPTFAAKIRQGLEISTCPRKKRFLIFKILHNLLDIVRRNRLDFYSTENLRNLVSVKPYVRFSSV